MIAVAAPKVAAPIVTSMHAGWFFVQERDHISPTDPSRRQHTRRTAHPIVELCPRKAAAQVTHRLDVGLGGRPVGKPVVQKICSGASAIPASVPRHTAAVRPFCRSSTIASTIANAGTAAMIRPRL